MDRERVGARPAAEMRLVSARRSTSGRLRCLRFAGELVLRAERVPARRSEVGFHCSERLIGRALDDLAGVFVEDKTGRAEMIADVQIDVARAARCLRKPSGFVVKHTADATNEADLVDDAHLKLVPGEKGRRVDAQRVEHLERVALLADRVLRRREDAPAAVCVGELPFGMSCGSKDGTAPGGKSQRRARVIWFASSRSYRNRCEQLGIAGQHVSRATVSSTRLPAKS